MVANGFPSPIDKALMKIEDVTTHSVFLVHTKLLEHIEESHTESKQEDNSVEKGYARCLARS